MDPIVPVSSPRTLRSLLDHICGGDHDAWPHLLAIYEPLLRHVRSAAPAATTRRTARHEAHCGRRKRDEQGLDIAFRTETL
jgi:hypothetical protein